MVDLNERVAGQEEKKKDGVRWDMQWQDGWQDGRMGWIARDRLEVTRKNYCRPA